MKFMYNSAVAGLVLISAIATAHAQQPAPAAPAATPSPQPFVDPRVKPQTVAVLQALVQLREAQYRVLEEDSRRMLAEKDTQIRAIEEKCGDACNEKKAAKAGDHGKPPPAVK